MCTIIILKSSEFILKKTRAKDESLSDCHLMWPIDNWNLSYWQTFHRTCLHVVVLKAELRPVKKHPKTLITKTDKNLNCSLPVNCVKRIIQIMKDTCTCLYVCDCIHFIYLKFNCFVKVSLWYWSTNVIPVT